MAAGSSWLLWQLADSALPVGGFAHSSGLESAVQLCEVPNVGDFAREVVRNTVTSNLPFVSAAHRGSSTPLESERHRVEELDRGINLVLAGNSVARRASIALGQAYLAALRGIPKVRERAEHLRAKIRAKEIFGHLAVVFGCACSWLEVGLKDTQRLFIFSTIRGVISAAVRLGSLGTFEAQGVQSSLYSDAEYLLGKFEGLSVDQAHISSPLVEIFQGCHDRLYSKLFTS